MKHVALSAGFLLACAASAQAAGELVLGDSLGVGVKIASGHAGPARLSQFIRNDQILTQLEQVPNGATAVLVLGTNDSAGSVKGLEINIDNIVRAVESRKINLVWVGPPCVRKSWDKNSRELDALLAARLASTTIKYVSLRSDPALCSGQYTGGDGVHLNLAGYSLVWNKARVIAGLPEAANVKVAVTPPPVRRRHVAPPPPTETNSFWGNQTVVASADENRPRRRRAQRQPEPEFNFFNFFRR